ncbi:lysozyme inhibitor LprI family protein [Amorphus sp. 3PC139-8]|uniref:lysozyme inhibitor LprI family protein n=1 Tax=Amorphus sp. 3PC139-8 TaxID=2735676 RepID=UPI00345DBD16
MAIWKLGFVSACAALAMCGSAAAQSFDCAKASKPDEKAICDSRELANLDVKNATLYEVMTNLVAMGVRGDQQDAERAFLEKRSACGADTSCIASAYQARIAEIQGILKGIYQNGPY